MSRPVLAAKSYVDGKVAGINLAPYAKLNNVTVFNNTDFPIGSFFIFATSQNSGVYYSVNQSVVFRFNSGSTTFYRHMTTNDPYMVGVWRSCGLIDEYYNLDTGARYNIYLVRRCSA
jgi:hypothetical protein